MKTIFYGTIILASTITFSPFCEAHQPPLTSDNVAIILDALSFLVKPDIQPVESREPLNLLVTNVIALVMQTSDDQDSVYVASLKKDADLALRKAFTILESDYKRPSTPEEKEAKAQAAICNVATVVNGVANIVQNPHDKINVGQSVGSILAGVINIAMLIAHKPH